MVNSNKLAGPTTSQKKRVLLEKIAEIINCEAGAQEGLNELSANQQTICLEVEKKVGEIKKIKQFKKAGVVAIDRTMTVAEIKDVIFRLPANPKISPDSIGIKYLETNIVASAIPTHYYKGYAYKREEGGLMKPVVIINFFNAPATSRGKNLIGEAKIEYSLEEKKIIINFFHSNSKNTKPKGKIFIGANETFPLTNEFPIPGLPGKCIKIGNI